MSDGGEVPDKRDHLAAGMFLPDGEDWAGPPGSGGGAGASTA